MNIKLKCESCDYKVEVMEEEVYSFSECALCGGRMVFDTGEPEIQSNKIIAERSIEKFIILNLERERQKLGNQRMYEIIEEMNRAETRARYRKYFLLAGGFIPENKILEEKDGKLFVKGE